MSTIQKQLYDSVVDSNERLQKEVARLNDKIDGIKLQKDHLIEAVELSVNGLEWYKDEHPQSWSEADEEHLARCNNLLASV